MRAAARRIVLLFGSAIVLIAALAAAIGLALGSSAARSAATGLYLVGCFLLVLGVFAGVRGPLRPSGEPGEDGDAIGSLLGVGIFSKGVRTATSDERADAHSTAWLFLAMGMAMIIVGIAVDPRTKLF
ncbi:MAG TPA: hypothetical protein VFO26_04255 [Gaiella sp.]|uniref:hypothetical protein n=1 Tax=Gaiella sp. TaxID=2663207 RepID=UPI002D803B18|nr:hypothetical protein [Gaiella sp.]HET9286751.1 hypothetical protein [Gaiella sp.]